MQPGDCCYCCSQEHFSFTECKETVLGTEFRGTTFAKTKTGLSCQRWDSDSPHDHGFNDDPAKMEAGGLEGLIFPVTLYFVIFNLIPILVFSLTLTTT